MMMMTDLVICIIYLLCVATLSRRTTSSGRESPTRSRTIKEYDQVRNSFEAMPGPLCRAATAFHNLQPSERNFV